MAQKILFINCSGVITSCELVDKVENLAFSRNAIGALIKISENTDFKIKLFARENKLSNAVLTKIIDTLVAESVDVDSIYTINELAQLATDADLSNSYIVSNCFDDFSLVSCGKILFATAGEGCNMVSDNWLSIAEFLTFPPRKAVIKRKTNETDIFIDLNLDGSGKSEIATGLHFFDHMLEQLARHSNCDMVIKVNGDLQVDEHHTMEDTAIALGEAFLKALGDKKRIERYGFLLPMDDCLAQAAIDFSGRPWLVWNAEFNREMIGDTPTEMFYHFFKSFSDSSKCNLNIKVEGTNEHHKIEAIFKATAKSIKQAVSRSLSNKGLPSTKGLL